MAEKEDLNYKEKPEEKPKHIILDAEGAKIYADAKFKLISSDPSSINMSDNKALKKIIRWYLDDSTKSNKNT